MFLTVNKFLECYPMARSTFYRLVSDGQLKITKFGRASRIRIDEAEEWARTLPTFCGRSDNPDKVAPKVVGATEGAVSRGCPPLR